MRLPARSSRANGRARPAPLARRHARRRACRPLTAALLLAPAGPRRAALPGGVARRAADPAADVVLLRYLDVCLVLATAPFVLIAGLPLFGYLVGAAAWLLTRLGTVYVQERALRVGDPKLSAGMQVGSMMGRLWILVLAILLARFAGGKDDGIMAAAVLLGAFTVYFVMSFFMRNPLQAARSRPSTGARARHEHGRAGRGRRRRAAAGRPVKRPAPGRGRSGAAPRRATSPQPAADRVRHLPRRPDRADRDLRLQGHAQRRVQAAERVQARQLDLDPHRRRRPLDQQGGAVPRCSPAASPASR